MSEKQSSNFIHSRIWDEKPEPNNPFATQAAYCRGYNVYEEMLGNSRWVEMLYLLFHEEAPSRAQADLLEALAVALANPGPRDASVHAAMCGGAGGSTAASCLIAALAVGAGQLAGGREIYHSMQGWLHCGNNLETWRDYLEGVAEKPGSIWPACEHPPGFDPHGVSTTTIVKQTLSCLASYSAGSYLRWLNKNRSEFETLAGYPLTLSGVAAAALAELNFTPEQGELVYLLLRLPGAAAHAMEQRASGHKKFPFGTMIVEEDGIKEQA